MPFYYTPLIQRIIFEALRFFIIKALAGDNEQTSPNALLKEELARAF